MNDPTRILIVEDSSTDAELAMREISKTITACIFEKVETHESFLAALDTFRPDLVVSDYTMPHFDGMTALKLTLERAPLTPVIIWTGSLNEDVAVKCMKAGASNYVLKDNIKRLGPAVIHGLEEKQVRLERKRAEEARREAEAKYRNIFENAIEGIFQTTPSGKLLIANPTLAHMLGYDSPEELIVAINDLNHNLYVQPTRREDFLKQMDDHAIVTNFESEVYGKEGNTFWISENAQVVCDDEGQVQYFEGTLVDITERKRAEKEVVRRADEFAALYDTARDLAEHQDLPTLLQTIVERAAILLAAPGGGMYLYDETRGDLRVAVSKGSQLPVGARIQFGEGMAGRVAQTHQPLIVNNYQTWEGRSPQYAGLTIAATIEVPMILGGELIGVLVVFETDDTARQFTETDARLLSLFASSAAGVVHNARLLAELQHHARQQTALYRISTTLAQLRDRRELCQAVVSTAREILHYPFMGIFLVDLATGDRVLQAQSGWDNTAEVWRLRPGIGVSEKALLTGELQYWRDATQEPTYVAGKQDTRSEVDVPIKIGNTVLGLLVVEDPRVAAFDADDFTVLQAVANQLAVALENTRLFTEVRARAEQLAALNDAALLIQKHLDPEQIYRTACEELRRFGKMASVFHLEEGKLRHLHTSLNEELLADYTVHFDTTIDFDIPLGAIPDERMPGKTEIISAEALQSIWQKAKLGQHPLVEWITDQVRHAAILVAPLGPPEQPVGIFALAGESLSEADIPAISLFAQQVSVALENARLYAAAQARAEELALLYDAGLTLNGTLEPRAQLELLCQIATKAVNANNVIFFRYDAERNDLGMEFGVGLDLELGFLKWERFPLGAERGLIGWVGQTRKPFNLPDVTTEPRWVVTDPAIRSALWVPILHKEQLLGVLSATSAHANAFTSQDESLLVLFSNQVAVAMENARLYHETHQRLVELEAVNRISTALRAAQTVEEMLPILAQETQKTLDIAAVTIWLYDSEANELRQMTSSGFPEIDTRLKPGEGIAGQVFQSGQIYISPDFKTDSRTHADSRNLVPPGLHGAAVPIRAADETIGVLFASVEPSRQVTASDVRLLTTVTEIAGNAIHRTRLYTQTLNDSIELANAYDATIEGWSRALDLRDKETEGHTERVTGMTLQLARRLGFTDEQLVHIRRGTLLHDIGKMGIPDEILLKPGTFNEREWEIMRRHPDYAQMLLAPIHYLAPALDIPYCHHEKWDGTGYPRRLKGEAIPLAARMFAVVDVWDAMTSDRPYRAGLPTERVREHIRAQSGIHFDPRVAETFLEMTRDEQV